jgi:hypothetical protein
MQRSVSSPVCELDVQLALSDLDRDRLRARLLEFTTHPYEHYDDFMAEIGAFASSGDVPEALAEVAADACASDQRDAPFVLIRNCPIDLDVPIFDYDEPVVDKRRTKSTFIAEGFLALWAIMRGTPPIGYVNVNDGDVFQDIFPKRSLKDSQSQKALGSIFFHKDLANHFVRPDYVNMLCMRASGVNEIYTSFVRNREALAALDRATVEQLRAEEYHTPYDDLTVAGKLDLGEPEPHPVLSEELNLRFFENRTHGTTAGAQRAVQRLIDALHRHKARVQLQPGDFLSEHNNFSIHCKEVVRVQDPDAQRARWIIKTVNVDDLAAHERHYVPGRRGIVAG